MACPGHSQLLRYVHACYRAFRLDILQVRGPRPGGVQLAGLFAASCALACGKCSLHVHAGAIMNLYMLFTIIEARSMCNPTLKHTCSKLSYGCSSNEVSSNQTTDTLHVQAP